MSTRRKSPLSPNTRKLVRRFTAALRKNEGQLFRRDPNLRDEVARLVRSQLPPEPRLPGRPCQESVTVATQMLAEFRQKFPSETPEKIWTRIYPQAIPGFDKMKSRDQIAAKLKLRDAVRSRKNTRRRRNNLGIIVPPGTISR